VTLAIGPDSSCPGDCEGGVTVQRMSDKLRMTIIYDEQESGDVEGS
jgi:hypothetical protein